MKDCCSQDEKKNVKVENEEQDNCCSPNKMKKDEQKMKKNPGRRCDC